MKKHLLQELILPSFWLFFFIVSPGRETKVNHLKKSGDNGVKKQLDLSASGITNTIDKNKEATLIKAVYLSGF